MPNQGLNDPRTIEEVLNTTGRIAIVGLSPKPDRDSYRVAEYLIHQGYDIVPVHPKAGEVLGRKAYPDLRSIEGPIDVVNVFLNPDRVLPVAQEAVEIGAKYFWLQLGIMNQEAINYAGDHDLGIVADRCIKVEHAARRL